VEPDYLPDSEVCFSCAWTPFPNGGCGGLFPPPPTIVRGGGGPGGGGEIFVAPPPLVGDSGAAPPKRNIGKNYLVKYCNFVVNLDRSL
jgi:hypothetical protein